MGVYERERKRAGRLINLPTSTTNEDGMQRPSEDHNPQPTLNKPSKQASKNSTNRSNNQIPNQSQKSCIEANKTPKQTFGVPPPVETGFAYAQFKCQYYCENASKGGSFFVRGDSKVGSYCNCYNEL